MKAKTPLFSMLLVVLCTFLTSLGQYFIKIGSDKIVNFISLFNWPLIIGFALYGVGAVILIIALKYGELSVLYPFIALSFVWVFLLSIFYLKEAIFFVNWVGLILIIIGVSLTGVGAKHD